MSIRMNHLTKCHDTSEVRTHGTVGDRFGGARKDGTASLYEWRGVTLLPTRNIKCSTYRKAQRKLLQWLKGYNVCSK